MAINHEVLGNQYAEYEKQIVPSVTKQLQAEYGYKGFEPFLTFLVFLFNC